MINNDQNLYRLHSCISLAKLLKFSDFYTSPFLASPFPTVCRPLSASGRRLGGRTQAGPQPPTLNSCPSLAASSADFSHQRRAASADRVSVNFSPDRVSVNLRPSRSTSGRCLLLRRLVFSTARTIVEDISNFSLCLKSALVSTASLHCPK